jgi:hypothetical protein
MGEINMFDANKTLDLVKDALLDPEPTWQKYFEEPRDWKDTAIILTLPVIAVCLVVGLVLKPISVAFFSIIMMAISITIWSLVVNFFAGTFKGTSDFDRSFAAVSLTAIPALVGNVLGELPWIGWLVSVGLGIYSLVLLYQIIPLAFSLPEDNRVKHFVVSLLSMIVAMMLIGSIFGGAMINRSVGSASIDRIESSDDDAPYTGMFTGIQQNADYAEQAEADRYSPPDDGELSEDQVVAFVSVLTKTKALQNEQLEKMKAFSDQAKESKAADEEPGLGDFFKAVSGATNIGFSEMKVVKTGGMNWAEHQWVRQQLDIARIQKDLNDAVKHNYALYVQYEDQLGDLF